MIQYLCLTALVNIAMALGRPFKVFAEIPSSLTIETNSKSFRSQYAFNLII